MNGCRRVNRPYAEEAKNLVTACWPVTFRQFPFKVENALHGFGHKVKNFASKRWVWTHFNEFQIFNSFIALACYRCSFYSFWEFWLKGLCYQKKESTLLSPFWDCDMVLITLYLSIVINISRKKKTSSLTTGSLLSISC